MATYTVYFYTSASDGSCLYDAASTWAIAHNASTPTSYGYSGNYLYVKNQNIGGTYFRIYRSYLYFNTSSLPDDCIIESARLRLYGWKECWTVITEDRLGIQNGQPDYPHDPLVESDYNQVNYSGDGGSLLWSEWVDNNYNYIDLSETGLGWINKTGVTKLCLRSGRDIDDISPDLNRGNSWTINSRNSGTAYARLTVTYEWTPPAVTTLPATSITDTTAILNGLANPEGVPILCGFEYGYDTGYGTTVWFNSSYSSAIDYFSVGIGGLIPEKGYHFRALAYDGTNYYYGADAGFTTTGTAYPATSKLLKGKLTYDGGGDCAMRFQWGTTTAYGNDTPWTTGKTTGAMHSYPLVPNLLTVGETYHFRAQARNKHSTADGADKSFVY